MQPQQTEAFGPFMRGVIDRANPGTDLNGALREAAGVCFDGVSRLVARLGTALQLTLMDDAGTPAPVTAVCGVGPYLDRAYAVAHSTNTNKVYLYLLTSSMDGWYDSTGILHATLFPQPAAVLWSGTTVAADVFVVEALGWLYFAHANAIDHAGLYFPSKQWDGTYPVALSTIKASSLDGTLGPDDAYFLGLISFQQHLWGWGYGAGNTPATAYRPELARFSQPDFGPFMLADSITIGTRVRSEREKIVCAGLAGEALILAGTYLLTRVTGQGRQSWYKQPVDQSRGVMGPKAGVSDGPTFYYYGPMGPERVSESGPADPLWYAVQDVVANVINPEKIVVTREELHELIVFHLDAGAGVRTRLAFHTQHQCWLGPDDDGLVIRAGGDVDVVKASVAPGVTPPSGPPTAPVSTDAIGATVATLHWTIGDPTASTQIEYRPWSASLTPPPFTVVTTVAPGINSYVLTGLGPSSDYEWRVAHVKSSQYSAYFGPTSATQFTTTSADAPLQPPTSLAAVKVTTKTVFITWDNAGAADASTEVWILPPLRPGYLLNQTAAPGVASAYCDMPTLQPDGTAKPGTYSIEIRHARSGVYSPYDGPVTVTFP
jgi:hypothetical protein